MTAPTLSVLLPNYNHADFLPKCLDEILGQSFTDFELIVVDDASTDDSVRVIEEYARRDDRIRFYRNPQNLGVVATLNRCLGLARGEFAHGAASDDYVLPGYFEEAVALLRAHPTAGLATGLVDCVSDDGRLVYRGPGMWAAEPAYLSPDELVRRATECGVPGPAVWRRDLFLAAGGYKPELKWHCDWFALQVVAFRHGACFIPRTTTVVRVTTDAYSAAGQRNSQTQRPVLQRMLAEFADPAVADVRDRVGASGVLSQFGDELVRAVATLAEVPKQMLGPLRGRVLALAPVALADPEPAVRAGVARLLPRYGREAEHYRGALAGLAAADPDPDVREAAAAGAAAFRRLIQLRVRLRRKVKALLSRWARLADRRSRPIHHERLERIEGLLTQLVALNHQLVAVAAGLQATADREVAARVEERAAAAIRVAALPRGRVA
ncbi:glycosyltransferase family 2 protein [bacterium]|nr:glycosyltransferase family 2 protein [bacterium]